MMNRLLCFLYAILALVPLAAAAEIEVSLYGGLQAAPTSDVFMAGDSDVADHGISVDWHSRSLKGPPYYGIRATIWNSPAFGYGLDFTHNKLSIPVAEMPSDFQRLEFSDGINTLTVNTYRRWDIASGELTPYVGGGLGVAIPKIEIVSGTSQTDGYQISGPAATWIAGATYPLSKDWSVFGEYKGTYSQNTIDLSAGGRVESDIVTNALNVGVSFNF